jgi:hypothetical protein
MNHHSSYSSRLARIAVVTAWAGLFAATASCAAAQASDNVTPLSCERASGVARGQDRTLPRGQGIAALGRCPHQFGDVVPELWRDATLSADEAKQLKWTSRETRDRRVFEALMEVVRNPSKGVDTRLAALAILTTYVEGSFGLTENDLQRVRPGDLLPRMTHSTPRDGEQPTGQPEVAQAIGLFVDLAEHGSPQEIRNAGQYLRQGLIVPYAAMMPMPTGIVTGSWDCQGHLALENTGTYAVPLALVDSAGAKVNELMLHAPGGARGRPSKVTLQFTRTGPLTVQFGGRPLLRFSCP